jgi:hypothetical protein
LPPYLTPLPPAPPSASPQAAVAAAAYETLKSLFPSSQTAFFDAKLAELGNPADPGHGFGLQVAEAILADRASDPSDNSDGYMPSPDRYRHRPDPDNPNQGFNAPFYGAKSKGFAITARHELDAPPRGDADYVRALRRVRVKGVMPELIGALPQLLEFGQRTPDETLIGIFWAYDGAIGIGTPPRLYNQIVRRVAIAKGNTEDPLAYLPY